MDNQEITFETIITNSKKFKDSHRKISTYYILSDNIGIQFLIPTNYPFILEQGLYTLNAVETRAFNKKFNTKYHQIVANTMDVNNNLFPKDTYYIIEFSLI